MLGLVSGFIGIPSSVIAGNRHLLVVRLGGEDATTVWDHKP